MFRQTGQRVSRTSCSRLGGPVDASRLAGKPLPAFSISVDIAGLWLKAVIVLAPIWQRAGGRWIHVAITAELKCNMVLAVPWGIGRWTQWLYHCRLQVRRERSLCIYIVSDRRCAHMYVPHLSCLTEKVHKLSKPWPAFRSSEVWFRKSFSHWFKVFKSCPDFLRL